MVSDQEVGAVIVEVCCRHGRSSATFNKFKAKCGGVYVSETSQLRALLDEKAKLKRLLPETMLDNVELKGLL